VCVYIYTHTHIYIYTYIYVYLYTYIYTYVYIYIHTYTNIYTCTHIYVYICIYIFVYMCVNIHIYIHTHIYEYICIYIYTHIYMSTCRRSPQQDAACRASSGGTGPFIKYNHIHNIVFISPGKSLVFFGVSPNIGYSSRRIIFPSEKQINTEDFGGNLSNVDQV